MRADGPVVLLVPIAPNATGNGLAMRAGMLLEALAAVRPVHVVVVPVSGGADDRSWAAARACTVAIVAPVDGDTARDHTTAQLADPELRARLERTDPLPARAVLAPPTLAPAVAAALPEDLGSPAVVLALRLYLAPLGIELARRLGAARVVVDVDDDDVALLRSLGDDPEADAYDRLSRCWLPMVDVVLAASLLDASGVASRTGLDHVAVAPNVATAPTDAVGAPPGADRLLFLGNLTYEPNCVAARWLAGDILPQLRRRRPEATLELVGPNGGSLDDLAGLPGVRVTGAVADVTPHYARTDAVVVPLRHGGGTRIKVLEAFAHERPVVATPVAVAGLEVLSGEHAVVAETTDELVRAVDDLLGHPGRASAMAARAARLVASRYSPAAVAPAVRAAVLGTRSCRQPEGPAAA